MLKLTTDKHEASRGLSATAEFLVFTKDVFKQFCIICNKYISEYVAQRLIKSLIKNNIGPKTLPLGIPLVAQLHGK